MKAYALCGGSKHYLSVGTMAGAHLRLGKTVVLEKALLFARKEDAELFAATKAAWRRDCTTVEEVEVA